MRDLLSASGQRTNAWLFCVTRLMKTDIVSALLFVGFVMVAVRAAWLGRHAQRRQQGVRLFLAYTMVASLAAGVFHRECWPFSRWQIFSYRYKPPVEALQIR